MACVSMSMKPMKLHRYSPTVKRAKNVTAWRREQKESQYNRKAEQGHRKTSTQQQEQYQILHVKSPDLHPRGQARPEEAMWVPLSMSSSPSGSGAV